MAVDVLSSGFSTGEVENAILTACADQHPDIIVVEGQGALSHPAFTSSAAILRGAIPDAIIVQHPPKRVNHCDYPDIPMPTLASEIELIEVFSRSKVVAITLNHEDMSDDEVAAAVLEYEVTYELAGYRCPEERLRQTRPAAVRDLSGTPGKGIARMSTPRIEIDLGKIEHNICRLKEIYGSRGVGISAVTKVVCGNPEIAEVLVRSGIGILADSRIVNIRRMRDAGVAARFMLLRTPFLSQVEAVVRYADISLNSDLTVIRGLSRSALSQHLDHQIILMVELGDLREGLMPSDVHAAVECIVELGGIELVGLGANLACFGGIKPDDENMGLLSRIAGEVAEAFGLTLSLVSGGNSANYQWFMSTQDVGMVNNLRLGESIYLGCETLQRTPIPGLFTDAFTLFAEVIESTINPSLPQGTVCQDASGRVPRFPRSRPDAKSHPGHRPAGCAGFRTHAQGADRHPRSQQ